MTRTEKKRLLVLATIGLLIAGSVAVAFPLKRKWAFYNKVISERESKIRLYQQQIVNKDPLVGEVARLNEIYDKTGFFFKSESASTAGAKLQRTVRGILQRERVVIRSTQVTSANLVPENRAEVKATVEFRSILSLVRTLDLFSLNKPTLRVTAARIRPVYARQRVKEGERYVTRNRENGYLKVTLTIQTFYEVAK